MMAFDYRSVVLVKRSNDVGFEDRRVLSSIVVGLTVEAALKLELRAEGRLPVPVEVQEPRDHTSVLIHNVLVPGRRDEQSVWVKVYPQDAKLAISIARGVLSKLKALQWQLVPLSADHCNPDIAAAPHDLLLKSTAGTLRGKLFSAEIKCREVFQRSPSGFNWREDLQKKADVLWRAELAKNPHPWAARILVFCELHRPCHAGDWRLHASISWPGRRWADLFGWSGFPPAVSVACTPATPLPRSPQGVLSEADLEAKWQKKLGSMEMDGDWVQISSFLRALREPFGHPLRHLHGQPSSKKIWRLGPRLKRSPREGVDWARRSGKRGGGAGPSGARVLGPIFGRVSFLREVAFVYYKHRL